MAEQVQAILESMVPHLKDLRSRGLFTPDEIRSIVNRRRQSEYLLQRRSAARKSDYLRYIEEELLLERLRKLRKEKVLTDLKNERIRRREEGDDDDSNSDDNGGNGSNKFKYRKNKKHAYQTSGPGDSHIISHTHFLYQRTLKKFHYPLDVILNYAQFAKDAKSFSMLGRIYAEGLQHHPRSEGLWIEAASFEYFGYVAQDYQQEEEEGGNNRVNAKVAGSSISNARILLQRGLRINTSSMELWLQYFALELHYVQKLRGRREILELGLKDVGGKGAGDVGNADKASDDDGEEGSNESESEEEEEEGIPTTLLPSQIIYKNAIKAVPTDVQFRLRFIEACRMFPQTKGLEEYIMETVTNDFGTSVEGWVARISYAEEQGGADGSSDGRKNKGGVGFLGKADEDSDEDGDGTNSDTDNDGEEERPAKKARVESNSSDPALDLLHQALEAVPSSKMYLECTRFLRLRIQNLLDQNTDDHENEDSDSHLIGPNEDAESAAQRHAHVLEELYASAMSKNVSSTNLVLDQVDFLLSTGQPAKAEQLLSKEADSTSSSRIWLRWADISSRMVGNKMTPTSSPVRILRKALKHTPIHERQAHLLILTQFMHQVMMQQPSLKSKEELKSLFQKLLLLSQGTSQVKASVKKNKDDTGDDDDEEEAGEVNVGATLLAYLKYSLLNNTDNANGNVRSIYTSVLYHSNYGNSCAGKTEEEWIAMKSFFDLCIQYEVTISDKKERKKSAYKMVLCKLYQAAIGFYESGSGGDSFWRGVVDGYQRELQDVKYSS